MLPLVTVTSLAPKLAPGASENVNFSNTVCPKAKRSGKGVPSIVDMDTVGPVTSNVNADSVCVSSLPARSATINVGV